MFKFLALYEGQTVATVELIGITGNEALVEQVVEHLRHQNATPSTPAPSTTTELPTTQQSTAPKLCLLPRQDVEDGKTDESCSTGTRAGGPLSSTSH